MCSLKRSAWLAGLVLASLFIASGQACPGFDGEKPNETIASHQGKIGNAWRRITNAKDDLRKQTTKITNEQIVALNRLIDSYNVQVEDYRNFLHKTPHPHRIQMYAVAWPVSEGDFGAKSKLGMVAGTTWVDAENNSYEFQPNGRETTTGRMIKRNPSGEVVNAGTNGYWWRQENRAVYAGTSLAKGGELLMTIEAEGDGSTASSMKTQYKKKP